MSAQRQAEQATQRLDRRHKIEMGTYGLRGIFWALKVLTDESVETLRPDKDREHAIVNLIEAGELLAKEVSDQF